MVKLVFQTFYNQEFFKHCHLDGEFHYLEHSNKPVLFISTNTLYEIEDKINNYDDIEVIYIKAEFETIEYELKRILEVKIYDIDSEAGKLVDITECF